MLGVVVAGCGGVPSTSGVVPCGGAGPVDDRDTPLIAVHLAWAEERPDTRRFVHDGRSWFMDVDPVLADRHIATADVVERQGRLLIQFTTTPEGADRLRRASRGHVDGPLALLYGGEVVSVPIVRSEVDGTEAEIFIPDGLEGGRERLEREIRARWPAGLNSPAGGFGVGGALRVANMAIEALERSDWRRVAELVDPAELEAWYAELVNRPQLAGPGPEVTVEQMKRWDPDMPDAVAEYQVERLRKDREEAGSWVSRELAGVEDPAELVGLTPVEAFARYLQARDPVWQIEQRLETLDPRIAPAVRPDELRSRREAIGVVPEGETMAHVVYRVALGPERPDRADDAGELAVVSLRRTAAGWRLIPRGQLFHHGGYTLLIEPSDEPGTGREP